MDFAAEAGSIVRYVLCRHFKNVGFKPQIAALDLSFYDSLSTSTVSADLTKAVSDDRNKVGNRYHTSMRLEDGRAS